LPESRTNAERRIAVEFNKNIVLQKYKDLRARYIEPYIPDISPEGYTVRYAKIPDPCLSSDLCSHRILQHFEAKKALCPRFYKKLPQGAIAESYAAAYYKDDGKIHHIEYKMDEARRYVTLRISDQLLVDYHVEYFPGRKPFITFNSMEWTEFDANGRPISVESFGGNGTLSGGTIISGEYYQYENGRLIHADLFKDFDTSGRIEASLLIRMVPDRITNPDVFSYDFQRTEGGILCTKTNHWSESKTYTGSFLMPEKELKKTEEYGIPCFL
jgi:hypothetical protein